MTDTPVDPDDLFEAPLELRRHPIRAFFWALLVGIGLALVLIVTKVISLAIQPVVLVVAIAVVLGVLWGLFGPAKEPEGPRPVVVIPGTEHDRPAAEPAAATERSMPPPDATATPTAEPSSGPADADPGDHPPG